MAGKSRIKWRDQDRKAVSRAVQKFNAKITRVGKKSPATAYWQPARLNVKEVTSQIRTRSDLQTFLRYVERYMKKGAEDIEAVGAGVALTKFEIKELEYTNRRVNRQKAWLKKQLTEGGYKLSNQQERELEPIHLTWKGKTRDRILKTVEFTRSSLFSYGERYLDSFKRNLLKAVDRTFNEFPELIQYIEERSVWELFGKDWSPFLEYEYLYGPDPEEERKETIMRDVLGLDV